MKIDKETVKKLSRLVQIKLSIEEQDLIASQLDQVLGSAKVINDVDTNNTKITSQTHGLKNILREDKVIEGLDILKYKNDANLYKRYFKVKKVL